VYKAIGKSYGVFTRRGYMYCLVSIFVAVNIEVLVLYVTQLGL
jgi:hypothetical protein